MTGTLTPPPHTPGHGSEAPFTITVRNDPNGSVVTLRGELDMSTAPQLDDALDCLCQPASPQTTLDCSGLTFCDSTGLTVLIRAHQQHQARSSRLAITASPPILERLLALTGLGDYLDTAATTTQTGPA